GHRARDFVARRWAELDAANGGVRFRRRREPCLPRHGARRAPRDRVAPLALRRGALSGRAVSLARLDRSRRELPPARSRRVPLEGRRARPRSQRALERRTVRDAPNPRETPSDGGLARAEAPLRHSEPSSVRPL